MDHLRKQDLVVTDDFEPVCAFDINLLVTLILSQNLKQMLLFRSCQDLSVLREVGHKKEDQEGDDDGDDALQNEDPSPAIFARSVRIRK
jgi:hypothetical protein